jgi:hypothetical protein
MSLVHQRGQVAGGAETERIRCRNSVWGRQDRPGSVFEQFAFSGPVGRVTPQFGGHFLCEKILVVAEVPVFRPCGAVLLLGCDQRRRSEEDGGGKQARWGVRRRCRRSGSRRRASGRGGAAAAAGAGRPSRAGAPPRPTGPGSPSGRGSPPSASTRPPSSSRPRGLDRNLAGLADLIAFVLLQGHRGCDAEEQHREALHIHRAPHQESGESIPVPAFPSSILVSFNNIMEKFV